VTQQLVVTIEPARPPEILPLLMAAYGLTERESAVVQALLRGESTHAIAQALHLSPYTVQDHFKSIFEKIGVSSRREVASRVFYGQYLDAYGHSLLGTGGSPSFAQPAR
jgi:DNA-binding NarL/FixJ family response regulator